MREKSVRMREEELICQMTSVHGYVAEKNVADHISHLELSS